MTRKCNSCGGDMYHYAGCGVGEHGERIPYAPSPPAGGPPNRTVAERDMVIAFIQREETRWRERAMEPNAPPAVTGRANAAGQLWRDIRDGRHVPASSEATREPKCEYSQHVGCVRDGACLCDEIVRLRRDTARLDVAQELMTGAIHDVERQVVTVGLRLPAGVEPSSDLRALLDAVIAQREGTGK